jgi:thiol-disulfide isomerase/thioredoxin
MDYLTKPVAFLENSDFNDSGVIINPNIPNSMPIFIMIQANFCHHCKNAKPAFQQFADNFEGKMFCASIQGDSQNPNVREIFRSGKIHKICPNFVGYPTYVVQYQGNIIEYNGGRRQEDLENFSQQLLDFISKNT